jgi:hypothetical protein
MAPIKIVETNNYHRGKFIDERSLFFYLRKYHEKLIISLKKNTIKFILK